jgi:hypothetical protein
VSTDADTPTPGEPAVPAAEPSPQPAPTPTVGAADATWAQPAGSALLDGTPEGPVDPHPEKLVCAAFAGGLVTAVLLKTIAKRRHA